MICPETWQHLLFEMPPLVTLFSLRLRCGSFHPMEWKACNGSIQTGRSSRFAFPGSTLGANGWFTAAGHKQRQRGNMGINGFYQRFDQDQQLQSINVTWNCWAALSLMSHLWILFMCIHHVLMANLWHQLPSHYGGLHCWVSPTAQVFNTRGHFFFGCH